MSILEKIVRQHDEKHDKKLMEDFIKACYKEATRWCKEIGINFLEEYVNELLEQQKKGNNLKEYIHNFADDETKCALDAMFYWAAYYKITTNK